MIKFKSGKEVSDSVGLLITILVRYPEISKINYEPEKQTIKLTYLIKNNFSEEELSKFFGNLKECILTFNYLQQNKNIFVEIENQINEDYITLDLYRDIDTFTVNELNVIIQLLHSDFPKSVIVDTNEFFYEDELQWQEELITDMLENLKNALPVKKLLAFRDEGKVRVFDK